MSAEILLRLRLAPDWDRIDLVREAVSLCVEATFASAGFRDALAMTTSELLENAVKYGRSDTPIDLSIEELSGQVMVVVSNHISWPSPHASALQEHLDWLHTFDDPKEAYSAALQRGYSTASIGGLGLVRIAHEGHCTLHCETSSSGAVTVFASCEPPAPMVAAALRSEAS